MLCPLHNTLTVVNDTFSIKGALPPTFINIKKKTWKKNLSNVWRFIVQSMIKSIILLVCISSVVKLDCLLFYVRFVSLQNHHTCPVLPIITVFLLRDVKNQCIEIRKSNIISRILWKKFGAHKIKWAKPVIFFNGLSQAFCKMPKFFDSERLEKRLHEIPLFFRIHNIWLVGHLKMKSLGMAQEHQIQSMTVEKLRGMSWSFARQRDGSLQSVKFAWKKEKREGGKNFSYTHIHHRCHPPAGIRGRQSSFMSSPPPHTPIRCQSRWLL